MRGLEDAVNAKKPGDVPAGGLLSSLSRSVLREVDDALADVGLPPEHWYVLDLIAGNDGIAMIDIARSLTLPPPTVTKFVDSLVSKALVFRLADEQDRRRLLVHASRRGSELHAATVVAVRDAERRAVLSLSDERRVRIGCFLSELTVAGT